MRPSAGRAQSQPDAQTLADQAIHRLDLQTELRREAEPYSAATAISCSAVRLAAGFGIRKPSAATIADTSEKQASA